jgi:hypothetical protein
MTGMRLVAIDVCPVWEQPDGWRRPGIAHEPKHPPVVGWCNVLTVELADGEHRLLLTTDAG